jgi:glycosyltransferase involved in cell wall biosynthesis
LKILQLIQKPQLRGAELFASQLSNHLITLGHEVKVVCLFDGDAMLPFQGEVFNLKRPLNKRFIDVVGWKHLANIIHDFKPDIVQANAGDTLKFSAFSKFFFRWKTPLVFRNANKVSDFVDTTAKKLFNRFLLNQVHHVISVSELCRQDFVSTYSFSNSKITTVPIGIELLTVDTKIPDDLLAIFSSRKVLLNVASLVPEKNQAALIPIVKKLVEQNVDVNMVVVGDGRLRQALLQQVEAAKLSDRFFFLGYRTDVLSIMANAKAFVLPSLIEGLPGVILEAMYCKTPVVAYDVGGISEVVKNEETGWLVKAGDEAGFVQAVQSVLQSDVKAITERAYDQVVKEYDNRVIAERFVEVYEEVVRKR